MMGQILKYQHKRKRVILIADFICGLLILLFAYTAISKLMEFEKFKHALSEAPLIFNYSTFFAAVVPVGELIIVLLLARPQTQKTGLLTATGLLSVFTIYLVLMVFIDSDLPCSCGGVIQQLSWKQHIVFNLFFMGLGITGIYFQRNRNKEDQGTNVQST